MKKIILRGIGASPGKGKGSVRIVQNENDYKLFKKGDVLVTKITDPSMVIMMSKASAIVCDIGGLGSHPSIVSREMGVPCVVNAKKATEILKNGDKIEVDGKKGEIYIYGQ